MATTNLFSDPAFKDGAFTSNDARVRAYAIQKTMRAMDLGAEFGAKIYVFWGGREGVETDAAKNPVEPIKRFREAINFLCEYSIEQRIRLRVRLRGQAQRAARRHLLRRSPAATWRFIPTLDHPEMCGVNPEVAHEHMAGLNFVHHVAAGAGAGKLFHIDLNDQEFGRYDQDFRFGAGQPQARVLPGQAAGGLQATTARATSTPTPTAPSDYEDVKDFARGCMRTYMILKEKARQLERRRRNPGDCWRRSTPTMAHGALPGSLQRRESRRTQRRHLRPTGARRARSRL